MKKYAVIVAAGSGSRMGGPVPKQFMLLREKPVLWHTLQVFLKSYADLEIILVVPETHMEMVRPIIQSTGAADRIRMVKGGETRYQSVKQGLQEVQHPSIVLIHDGVRCLVTQQLIHRCHDIAVIHGNAIPAMTSTDSIRIEQEGHNAMVDRDSVKIIQTPQTFRSEIICAAFDRKPEGVFTDEAAVAERSGINIILVEGEETNIKITKPLDLVVAGSILEKRENA